ncbi:MAG: succinate dehydrogenase cytochrome b subunit [Mobilicoccus sp.]|nr:succinate dehydrogenase cytochrome b subunit [Mobilicoccus sp.]
MAVASITERGTTSARIPTWLLKVVMAGSGLLWAFFAVVHLWGNLKIYAGAESFDSYAHWLREVGYPLVPHEGVLWALRIALVVALVAHIWAAWVLTARSRRARGPVKARRRGAMAWNAAAMLPTGVILLVFLVIHVLDLTLGTPPVGPDGFVHGSAYANLVASFSRPWAAITYVVAMLAIAVHVAHGTVLAANDLGAQGRGLRTLMAAIGGIAALALLLGNASIPIAVQIGALS